MLLQQQVRPKARSQALQTVKAGSAQQVRMDLSAVTTMQLHANSPIAYKDAFTNSTASKLGSSAATPSEDEDL
jgi:hypothetical protein